MKTTLEIPDDLLRETEASAALRGESLKDFVAHALRAHLADAPARPNPTQRGWRSVFGKADAGQVKEIDQIVSEEFERTDPAI